MIRKNDLLTLPLPKTRPIDPGKHYLCIVQNRELKGEKVTIYNFWKGNKTLYFRTFCWGEDKFATWVEPTPNKTNNYPYPYLTADKWHNAMVDKYIYRGSSWGISQGHSKPFAHVDGSKAAERLYSYQLRIRRKQNKTAEKLKRRTSADLMSQIGPLPKDLNKFMIDRVFLESRYIYYESAKKRGREGRTIKGFCTHCKNEITQTISKAGQLHNEKGRCPNCKSSIIYKAVGKVSKYLRDDRRFHVMQRTRDGVVVRGFSARIEFHEHWKNPTISYDREWYRIFVPENGPLAYFGWDYVRDRYADKWKYQWKRYSDKGMLRPTYGTLYTRNLKQVLKGTVWQYSAISDFAKDNFDFCPEDYLKAYQRHPCLEYLVKMGLTKAVAEHFPKGEYYGMGNYSSPGFYIQDGKILNPYGRNLPEVLPTSSKQDIPFLAAINAGVQEIKFITQMRKIGRTVCPKNIEWQRSLKKSSAHHYVSKAARYCNLNNIQLYMSTQKDASAALEFWADYLEMAHFLGLDLSSKQILYPENIKLEHDRLAKQKKVEGDAIYDKVIAALTPEYKRQFSFEKDGLFIKVPESGQEITQEGKTLSHCVWRYVEEVAKEETIILFIRKKRSPNKPFYTLEILNNRVEQCRGKCNANMTDEVKKFIEEFKKACLGYYPQKTAS